MPSGNDEGSADFEALRARLEEVVKKTGLSGRALSTKAGLSPSFVESILNRRSKSPEAANVRKLAAAAGVNPDWFLTGVGGSGEHAVSKEERYVAMPAVRLMARTDGMPEAFVASFEAQLDFDYQPSADDLWTICKGEYARWRGKRASGGGDPLAGLDGPRVRPASKKR